MNPIKQFFFILFFPFLKNLGKPLPKKLPKGYEGIIPGYEYLLPKRLKIKKSK